MARVFGARGQLEVPTLGRASLGRGDDEPREIDAVAGFLKVRRGQHSRAPSVPLGVSPQCLCNSTLKIPLETTTYKYGGAGGN